MAVRSSQQRLLWEFVELMDARLVDARNKLGPFHLEEGEQVYRHASCRNFESCLDFAANNKWPSFDCRGCRLAENGRFE